MTWVDPETVTSLIEASGREAGRPIRPTYDGVPGWPLLVPADATDAIELSAVLELVGEPTELVMVDLGDPGTTTGIATALDALPRFEGPPEPVGGPPPEWGAAAADEPD